MLRTLIERNLLTGMAEIDAEHMEIGRLASELIRLVLGGGTADNVWVLARTVADAASAHFSHEEDILIEAGYPDQAAEAFAAHMYEHGRIRSEVGRLLRQSTFSLDSAMAVQVMLIDHLLYWDVKYKSFLKWSAGRQPAATTSSRSTRSCSRPDPR